MQHEPGRQQSNADKQGRADGARPNATTTFGVIKDDGRSAAQDRQSSLDKSTVKARLGGRQLILDFPEDPVISRRQGHGAISS